MCATIEGKHTAQLVAPLTDSNSSTKPPPSAGKKAPPSPLRSWRFIAIVSVVLWLVVSAPLAVLLSWLTDQATRPALGISLLITPLLTLWMWVSVQSANTKLKWPAMQLLGTTTILMSVVVVCLPLLWIIDRSTTGLIALVLWLLLCAYAAYSALSIKTVQLRLNNGNGSSPLRLVQISDVHIGSRSKAFMQRVVDLCNSHQPDLVVITGDLLDASSVTADDLQPLSSLQSPTWMCLGNHERYVDLQAAIAAVEQQGVKILRNQTELYKNLCIMGIDDADHAGQVGHELPKIDRPDDTYNILLYHRPSGWDDAVTGGIDLMLSGHTHGGQIWPFGILVKKQFPRMLGLFSNGDQHLYVSAGTGTWGPTLRLGTRSEITVIDLVPAQDH